MEQRPTEISDPTPEAPRPPVLRMINDAHRRLEYLLLNIERQTDAQSEILAVARSLSHAVELHPDVALACILLNQNEGSYAVRHCVDTAVVAQLVSTALHKGPHEILTVMAAALTMNVGMLQHQEQLQTRLNAISPQELAMIQEHPQRSVDLLRRAGVDNEDWLSYVLLHHENEDGSGYPFGKSAADIPLPAKVVSLADRYCARVSSRSYRKSLLPNEALNDILLADHQSVDPMLTACFIRVLGIYPTGAMVRLANGEIGAVTGKGESITAPIVHALVAADGRLLAQPVRRNTVHGEYAVREMLSEERAGVRLRMQSLWGDEAQP
ncbi:MAG TPA: HD domain-containing phosphohydrolase [Paucimonas sp.]|nr:HD domain-containing phosphohydrolase [Paucimonas sp.]